MKLQALLFVLYVFMLIGIEARRKRTAYKRVVREEDARLVTIRKRPNATETEQNGVKENEQENAECDGRYQPRGPAGRDGVPGIPGIPGSPGLQGPAGRCDCEKFRSSIRPQFDKIRQCAWNQYNLERAAGEVQACSFNKQNTETALRVEWHGVTRIRCLPGNSSCCARWYFTFNGGECVNPQPIDSLIYVDTRNTVHRSASVVGVCWGLPTGINDIRFVVGDCVGDFPRGDVKSGWNSSSRILIQEVIVYN